jgi:predicted branched-subunit amino acid permease
VNLLASPAVRMGISISIATGLYGVSFGALSVTSGLNFWQTMALSLLLFSGGSQFAFIGVVAGGGSGIAAMSAATLLGMRNGIYGMQLNALLHPTGWRKYVAAQLTIDESTATSSGQADPAEQRRGFWAAGIGIYVLWNLFTAVGALAGSGLGDPKQWGLDGAAVAAFLGLLWPRLKGREPVAIAVVCAVASVIAVPFVPTGARTSWTGGTRQRTPLRGWPNEPVDLAAGGLCLGLRVEADGLFRSRTPSGRPSHVAGGGHDDHRTARLADGGEHVRHRPVARR